MSIDNIFKGLHIDNYFKYLLVLCGVILILTIFVDVRGINESEIRHITSVVIIGCLAIWFIERVVNSWSEMQGVKHWHSTTRVFSPDDKDKIEATYYDRASKIIMWNYYIQGLIWLVILVYLIIRFL